MSEFIRKSLEEEIRKRESEEITRKLKEFQNHLKRCEH